MREIEKIWLDSETFSHKELKKVGVYNYTDDCEPILITYAYDDEPVQVWQVGEPLPKDLVDYIEQGVSVYAHNAMFDYLALTPMLPIKLEQLRDTMAIATANHLPASLDQQGKVMDSDSKKLATGTRLINHFCKPNKQGRRHTAEDSPEKWAEFVEYALEDVEAMRANTQQCRELSDREQQMWLLTQKINMRGVPVNLDSAKHFLNLAGEVKKELNKRLQELTGVGSASQVAKLKAWLNEQGAEVDSLNKQAMAELVPKYADNPLISEVLEIRKQASMTSTAKFEVFLNTAHNGRIKGGYMYHGANTGRFASRGGLNLQNIPRGSEKDAVQAYEVIRDCSPEDYLCFFDAKIEPLSSVIRPTIEAPEGKTFVDYDYSSIENRVAAWIGNQPELLDLFANGLDEYKDFATQIYHVEYEDVTKDMRQMAKSAILGSIFGAGGRGLQGYCEGFGLEISLEEAQNLVNIYRGTHRGIVKAWYAFGQMAMKAIRRQGKVFRTNHCALKYDGDFLRLQLPSKRIISWYAPKIEMVKAPWGDEIQAITIMKKAKQGNMFVRQQLIGSSIFQSVVQATARDILMDAMYRLDQVGYDIVMTTHDEVVAEVDEGWDNTEEFERIMTTNPELCPEIPLEVEGWIGKNYRK